jgi:hypothetical protein
MKKKNATIICNIISIILIVAFVVKSIVDYFQYSSSLNSAPFYTWIVVNAIYLIVPAIIVFVIGVIIKKRQ